MTGAPIIGGLLTFNTEGMIGGVIGLTIGGTIMESIEAPTTLEVSNAPGGVPLGTQMKSFVVAIGGTQQLGANKGGPIIQK